METKENKHYFYRSLISLVVPVAIQNLMTSAVGFADVFMIGFVGQDALAAVSLANQYQFLLVGLFFGLDSGIILMASQYWGKKDLRAIQMIMGIAGKIALAVTFLIMLLTLTCPRALMLVFTDDPVMIDYGVTYLRIVGVSYFVNGIARVYEATLRSMERAAYATAIATSAMLLNIVLNAVFIFGLFGLPKLGVAGVALATLISRIVECLICLYDFFVKKTLQPDLQAIIFGNKDLFKDFVKFSIPAILNDMVWTVAFTSYSVIMGHMSSDVVAANAVTTNVRNILTIVCFAMTEGGSVLLGKTVGEGKLEMTKLYATRMIRITIGISLITGAILLLIRPIIPHFFQLTDTANGYLKFMLLINSYYILGQAINTLLIAGIFRVGGNTRFGLICDTIDMWVVSVPLGFLSAFVLKLPPMTVYFILCLDEFWKWPVVFKYYKSYKWLKDITREV